MFLLSQCHAGEPGGMFISTSPASAMSIGCPLQEQMRVFIKLRSRNGLKEGGHSCARGSVRVKLLPRPRPALSARISPPIAFASDWAIVRPMPDPPKARERDL